MLSIHRLAGVRGRRAEDHHQRNGDGKALDSGRSAGRAVGRRAEKELEENTARPGGRTSILELKDVTFLDKDAEKLLHAMSKKGTQFVAEGIYLKHVLEQLKRSSKCERNHEGATL
jgi:hypothetical protein